ncbi:hypothetical protein [Endozoicomonas sp. ALC020]|uniref:hypothetical protein n=1 Tax=unclassified Endozoicomonas TaxID=2644528 RepID=UPI003BAFC9BB
MSLEARVERLEEQHRQMDANMHSLVKVCADTQSITMTNQHDIADLKLDIAGVKSEVIRVKSDLSALTQATLAGFKRVDERFEEHDRRFDKIDKRLDEHDRRFDEHDKRFDRIDKRLDEHDKRFDRIDGRFDEHDKRFDKIEETLAIIVNHLKK